MPIYLHDRTRTSGLVAPRVRRLAKALLDAAGRGGDSLSVTFVGDRAMRTLNRQHRGKDAATDVLSFPLIGDALHPGVERLLGDVVISIDTARRQARAYGAGLEREVQRLLIHGILHLLGHDHGRRRERERMEQAERELARAIGMPWPYDGEP